MRVSPCAYLAGLLHPLVIEELNLPAMGYSWTAARNGLFIPFEDGSSVQLYDDDAQCEEEIHRLSPRDVAGWRAMSNLIGRTRDGLRPPNSNDLWIGEPPTREQIEDRLGNDQEAIDLLFNWSMADLVEHYLTDERLQSGYLGQGVIGTNAVRSILARHPFVFIIHRAASAVCLVLGATLRAAWAGLFLFSRCRSERRRGHRERRCGRANYSRRRRASRKRQKISAPIVISNADPRTTLRLLGSAADSSWRAQIESLPIEGCTLKLSVWLRELPNFRARPGTLMPHHFAPSQHPSE